MDWTGKTFGADQRFKVERRLRTGLLGASYLARDTENDQLVCLLVADACRTEDAVARLQAEPKRQSGLAHPHIVPFGEALVFEDTPALTSGYIQGSSLDQYLRQFRSGMPIENGLQLFDAIAAGVQSAHDEGIVHLSLSPQTVYLVTGPPLPEVRLVDFGAVHIAGLELLKEYRSYGLYRAPEQQVGIGDQPADIYALGAVLFKMVTGKAPLGATSLAGSLKPNTEGLEEDVAAILVSELPLVLRQAMQRGIPQRYQSVGAFRADVLHVVDRAGLRRRPMMTSDNKSVAVVEVGPRGEGANPFSGEFPAVGAEDDEIDDVVLATSELDFQDIKFVDEDDVRTRKIDVPSEGGYPEVDSDIADGQVTVRVLSPSPSLEPDVALAASSEASSEASDDASAGIPGLFDGPSASAADESPSSDSAPFIIEESAPTRLDGVGSAQLVDSPPIGIPRTSRGRISPLYWGTLVLCAVACLGLGLLIGGSGSEGETGDSAPEGGDPTQASCPEVVPPQCPEVSDAPCDCPSETQLSSVGDGEGPGSEPGQDGATSSSNIADPTTPDRSAGDPDSTGPDHVSATTNASTHPVFLDAVTEVGTRWWYRYHRVDPDAPAAGDPTDLTYHFRREVTSVEPHAHGLLVTFTDEGGVVAPRTRQHVITASCLLDPRDADVEMCLPALTGGLEPWPEGRFAAVGATGTLGDDEVFLGPQLLLQEHRVDRSGRLETIDLLGFSGGDNSLGEVDLPIWTCDWAASIDGSDRAGSTGRSEPEVAQPWLDNGLSGNVWRFEVSLLTDLGPSLLLVDHDARRSWLRFDAPPAGGSSDLVEGLSFDGIVEEIKQWKSPDDSAEYLVVTIGDDDNLWYELIVVTRDSIERHSLLSVERGRRTHFNTYLLANTDGCYVQIRRRNGEVQHNAEFQFEPFGRVGGSLQDTSQQ